MPFSVCVCRHAVYVSITSLRVYMFLSFFYVSFFVRLSCPTIEIVFGVTSFACSLYNYAIGYSTYSATYVPWFPGSNKPYACRPAREARAAPIARAWRIAGRPRSAGPRAPAIGRAHGRQAGQAVQSTSMCRVGAVPRHTGTGAP